MSFSGNLDAKLDGLFGSVDRSAQRGGTHKRNLAVVPRAPRPVEPGKIDLSKAPSAMEERAKQWSGR